MNDGPLIQTTDLTKVYGMGEAQVAALDGVSIEIESGEFVAIMGRSGSGKSTLMNILGCLDRPSEGHFFLNGEDVRRLSKVQLAAIRNRQIGFVFQSYNLLPRTSALRNVELPLLYDRSFEGGAWGREARAREALAAVGLADRIHHHPQEMSGGEQQRVAIARAMIHQPLLILADEPTGNLDTKSGSEIMELFQEIHHQGRTIIFVTHESEIADHSQRRIYLRDGKLDTTFGETPGEALRGNGGEA